MIRSRVAAWLCLLITPALLHVIVQAQTAPPNPSAYDAEVSAARRLSREKQFRQAIDTAERAITLDPNRWEAHAAAAEAYIGAGLADDAIGMLQLALARAPQDKKPSIRELIDEVRKQASRATVAVAPAAPAVAAPPSPQDVLGRAVASIGGHQAIANVRTLILVYSLTGTSGTSDFRQYIRLPDAERTELAPQAGSAGMVFVKDNGSAWSKYGRDPAETTTYSAPVLWWDGLLDLAKGRKTIDRASITGDEMTLRYGDSDVILDLATGLMRRSVTRWTYEGVPYTSETTFSDYRRVEDVLWPFSWRSTTTSPTGNSTLTYTHVEINRPLSPALFQPLR